MKGKKSAGKFGGRPVEREPQHGKRTHLNLALPLPLKRRIEREAAKQGRSISSEAAYRLQQSFETEKMLDEFGKVLVEVVLKATAAQRRSETLNIEDELREVRRLIGAKERNKK